jgi:hypothetical protein
MSRFKFTIGRNVISSSHKASGEKNVSRKVLLMKPTGIHEIKKEVIVSKINLISDILRKDSSVVINEKKVYDVLTNHP